MLIEEQPHLAVGFVGDEKDQELVVRISGTEKEPVFLVSIAYLEGNKQLVRIQLFKNEQDVWASGFNWVVYEMSSAELCEGKTPDRGTLEIELAAGEMYTIRCTSEGISRSIKITQK